jgi:hypothetical protein
VAQRELGFRVQRTPNDGARGFSNTQGALPDPYTKTSINPTTRSLVPAGPQQQN